MPNHPNRSGKHPSRTPTAAEVRAAREVSGLTIQEAAARVHSTAKKWGKWESGERRMHPAIFELFNLKVNK